MFEMLRCSLIQLKNMLICKLKFKNPVYLSDLEKTQMKEKIVIFGQDHHENVPHKVIKATLPNSKYISNTS